MTELTAALDPGLNLSCNSIMKTAKVLDPIARLKEVLFSSFDVNLEHVDGMDLCLLHERSHGNHTNGDTLTFANAKTDFATSTVVCTGAAKAISPSRFHRAAWIAMMLR